jgi:hypothetical protein
MRGLGRRIVSLSRQKKPFPCRSTAWKGFFVCVINPTIDASDAKSSPFSPHPTVDCGSASVLCIEQHGC